MTRYPVLLARRMLEAALVLLAVSSVTFLLVAAAPGDVATSIAHQRFGDNVTETEIRQVRHELHLDTPLAQRYGHDLIAALRGDFGDSLRTQAPVSREVADRLPATLALAGLGGALAIAAGVALGLLCALWRRRILRQGARLLALVAVSVPAFVAAYLLVLELALRHHWLPTQGHGALRSYVLPATVLALPFAGALSRVVATSLDTVLREPYITTARARGVSPWWTVLGHALPNAGVTIITVAGTGLGQLLGLTVVIEKIFSWPGIANYFLRAVEFRDLPAIQASVVVFAAGFLLTRAAAAAMSAALDARSRTSTP